MSALVAGSLQRGLATPSDVDAGITLSSCRTFLRATLKSARHEAAARMSGSLRHTHGRRHISLLIFRQHFFLDIFSGISNTKYIRHRHASSSSMMRRPRPYFQLAKKRHSISIKVSRHALALVSTYYAYHGTASYAAHNDITTMPSASAPALSPILLTPRPSSAIVMKEVGFNFSMLTYIIFIRRCQSAKRACPYRCTRHRRV